VCESKQIGVRELFVSVQPGLQVFDSSGNLKAVTPEFVSRMGEILAKERERVDRR
jgi:hypothetical protein